MAKINIPEELDDFTNLLTIYVMERISVNNWNQHVDPTPRMGHAHSVLQTLESQKKNKKLHDEFVKSLKTSLSKVQTSFWDYEKIKDIVIQRTFGENAKSDEAVTPAHIALVDEAMTYANVPKKETSAFLFTLAYFAISRARAPANDPQLGFSHASSIQNALKEHKGIMDFLKKLADPMVEIEKDPARVREMAVSWVLATPETVTPTVEKYIDEGISLAYGLAPKRPTSFPGEDLYGDAQQKPVSKWELG